MLQNLFNRFDELCDSHGVMKLETIGDAYICATNLLEDDDDQEDVAKDAAIRALAMAKDMVCEARNVCIPRPEKGVMHNSDEFETLEIRVGIHVGDITCGVLGQRLPKFTTCGTGEHDSNSDSGYVTVLDVFSLLVYRSESSHGSNLFNLSFVSNSIHSC